jgi:hypothetical protein
MPPAQKFGHDINYKVQLCNNQDDCIAENVSGRVDGVRSRISGYEDKTWIQAKTE